MEFIPFDKEAEFEKWRRHLPHWEQTGRTYFVTFRLGDSIPKAKLAEWKAEKAEWETHHPKPWSDKEWKTYRKEFLDRIERCSDRGYGECHFGRPPIREIVSDALIFFDSEDKKNEARYEMNDFVIMPNHVHLLVRPLGEWKLGQLIHSWKSFTAHRINKQLNRSGSLWMDERFDHLVRISESLEKFQGYIAENPMKARLKPGEYHVRPASRRSP